MRMFPQKNLLENLIDLVDRYGYVPNGSREYYLGRSEPPMLTLMVEAYYDWLGEGERYKYIDDVVDILEEEYAYYTTGNHSVEISENITLSRYYSDIESPRPEYYLEDMTVPPKKWSSMRATAESGWDFSSRWCNEKQGVEFEGCEPDFSNIDTSHIIPVDLNVILYKVENALQKFYTKLGNKDKMA
eukprot:UN31180